MLRYFSFFLFLMVFNIPSATAYVKYKELPVRYIDLQNMGLVGHRMMAVAKDGDGFIWFITEQALHRYDGYSLKVYRHLRGDKNSLPHTDLFRLHIDRKNNIWLATGAGLVRFNIAQEEFEVVGEFQLKHKPGLDEDSEGNIWYIQGDNVLRYDLAEDRLVKLNLGDELTRLGYDTSGQAVTVLLNDHRLLSIIKGKECLIYDTTRAVVEKKVPDKIQDLCRNARSIDFENNNLFIFSEEGDFYQYNVLSDQLIKYLEGESHLVIYEVMVDSKGNIWVGTNDTNLRILPESNVIQRFDNTTTDKDVFLGEAVNHYYEDEKGNIYMASERRGYLAMYNPDSEDFVVGDKEYPFDIDFTGKVVDTIYSDKQGILWVAIKDQLYTFDFSEGKRSQRSLKNENCSSCKIIAVYDIKEDLKGRIWFATNDGLYLFKRETGGIESFEKKFPQENTPIPTSVTVISFDEDSNGDFWLGTAYQGLFRFNVDTLEYTQFLHDTTKKSSILANVVVDVLIDRQQRIWASTLLGLSRLDDINSSAGNINFKNYTPDVKDPNSLCGRMSEQILEDKSGKIWFATNHGLAYFNEAKNSFSCIDDTHGLPASSIVAMAQGPESSTLWVASPKGLSHIDAQGQVLRNISMSEGLFGEPSIHALATDANGRFWLGTKNGMNRFDAKNLHDKNKIKQNIAITGIRVDGEEVVNPLVSNRLRSLELPYLSNLSLSFAQLDYSNLDAHQYRVKLQGYDRDWLELGEQNQVQFRRLPNGRYTLKIALLGSGQEGDAKTIEIHVLTPWWKSYIAWFVYVLMATAAVYWLIRGRTSLLEKRAKSLELVVEERLKETIEQKRTIEDLLDKKKELFANVSHEFRTPLTLIIGPVNAAIAELRNKSAKEKLSLALSNANRLLRMVDQLLDLARLDKSIDQEMSIIDVEKFIQHILACFSTVIEQKKITLNTDLQEGILLSISIDALEKITVNLISNAIKYSPEGACISIQSYLRDGLVNIDVRDTGYGIAAEDQNKIFERFVRINNERDKNIPGAGIGLALVKQLVESNHGSISVESEANKGTCFHVSFPWKACDKQAVENSPGLVTGQEVGIFIEPKAPTDFEDSCLEASQDKKTILIVEDNADLRNFIHDCLKERYDCLMAEDGKHGIKMALEHRPDLILTDLMMPNKNGFEFAQVIKNDIKTSHIPIIMLTARADLDTRKNAWKNEIDEYIEKPFNAEELLLRCQNLIHIRQNIRTNIDKSAESNDASDVEHISSELNERDKQFLQKLQSVVSDQYNDPKLSASMISEQLAMSNSQLQRRLKALLGQSIPEYIRLYRMKKGVEFMSGGKGVTETAYSIGFSNSGYFSSCFKAHYGMSPTEYISSKEE